MRFLFWVWSLLFVIIYVFAVFLTRMGGHMYDGLKGDWGDVPTSMLTLYTIMTIEGIGFVLPIGSES